MNDLFSSRSVIEALDACAARYPDAIAVDDDVEALTYRELHARADVLTEMLARRGVRAGDRVGISLRRTVTLVASALAVVRRGAAYVPLDPGLPLARREFVVADAGLKTVIADAAAVHDEAYASLDVIAADEAAPAATDQADEAAPAAPAAPVATAATTRRSTAGREPAVGEPAGHGPQDIRMLIYTSGSTGRPKGVEVMESSLLNMYRDTQNRHRLGPGDSWLAVTSLSFDIHTVEIFLPLMTGGTVLLARDEMLVPDRLAAWCAARTPSIMQSTPSLWRALIEAGWKGDTSSLTVLTAGEPLNTELAAALCSRSREVWNYYGPTETSVYATCGIVEPLASVPNLGGPLAGTRLYVLDPQGEPVADGETGELHIAGAGLANGYHGRPGLTASSFVPDPFSTQPGDRMYRTGDLVRRDEHDGLVYVSRVDNQVKIRGHRIELGEIEAALQTHPRVKVAVAVAPPLPADPTERRLVVYYQSADDRPPTARELRAHLTRRLPAYMVPSLYVRLDSIPLTPTGKIDRKSLETPRPISRSSIAR
jgi:amino acid adenylation domain-containing protein